MSIFAIADLHLGLSVDKPMDVFGPAWNDHVERLEKNWREKITSSDTVLIPGDISWGISMEEALADLKFIDGLPGTKILSKGNHDYWWGTTKKVEDFMAANGLTTLKILKNKGFVVENTLIAGTRGWILPENPESKKEDEKIYLREVGRLERSLVDSIRAFEAGEAEGESTDAEALSGEKEEKPDISAVRKIAMLHYPPIYETGRENEFTKVLEQYGFDLCLYGHLHGRAHQSAFNGEKNGVEYRLIAADYLRFDPVEV
ncbi:MAG: metallophosphoesterase [Clostridiales bacterium]|nr:metallophosphoesterase [Clostridiales bacterium]